METETHVSVSVFQFPSRFQSRPSLLTIETTVPSPWMRSYSAGRYNLGSQLRRHSGWSLALGRRSRASLSLRPRARDQPSCCLAAPPRSTTLVLWPVLSVLDQGLGLIVLAIVPEYSLVHGQAPNIPRSYVRWVSRHWELPEISTLRRTQICVRSIAETASKRPKKCYEATASRDFYIRQTARKSQICVFLQICQIQNRIRQICVLNAFQTQIFFYVFSTVGPPLLGRTSIIFHFFDGWLPTTNHWSKW